MEQHSGLATFATPGARTAISGCLFILAAVTGRSVAAQDAGLGAGPSFVAIRYASRGSHTFYAGYQVGRLIGFMGLVQNRHNDYREAVLGLGTTLGNDGGNSVLVGVAIADASDGWYSQLYVVPDFAVGRIELSGTIEYYQPLQRAQPRQFYTSPLNVLWLARPGIAVGAAYLLSLQAGTPVSHSLGPSVRLAIPGGTLRLDIIRTLAAAPDGVRLTLTTSF